MAIIKVSLTQISGGQDDSGPTYELVYLVRSDSKYDGPRTARLACGWTYGDQYELRDDNNNVVESDSLALVNDIQEQQVSDGNYRDWEVTVSFAQPNNNAGALATSPLTAPVEFSHSFSARQEKVAIDLDNKLIVNAAGSLFDHSRDNNLPTFSFVRNEATFNQALVLATRNAVNVDAVWGYAARTIKVQNIQHERVVSSAVPAGFYYRVTYTFAVDPDTWRYRPLDAGLYELIEDDAGDKILSPITIRGREVESPYPLKTDGTRVTLNPTTGMFTENPRLLNFRDYPEVTYATVFAGLG